MARRFVVSGLLDHRTTELMSKVPGIGDVPILGALFRSKNFNHSVVELVILVTASVVDPLDRSNVQSVGEPKFVVPNLTSDAFDASLPAKPGKSTRTAIVNTDQPTSSARQAMTSEINLQERPNQAIFSVCVDQAVVAAATAASLKVAGAHFAGEFRDYITSDKRPQFSPSLKNAAFLRRAYRLRSRPGTGAADDRAPAADFSEEDQHCRHWRTKWMRDPACAQCAMDVRSS